MRVLDREWGKGGWATLETTQEDQQMREKRNNGINFVSMEFIAVPVQFEDLAINSQDMLRLLLVPLINSTQIIQVLQNWSFLPLPDIYYWIRRTFRSALGDIEKERRTRPKDSTLLYRRLGLLSGVGLEVVVVVVARSDCGRRSLEAIKQSKATEAELQNLFPFSHVLELTSTGKEAIRGGSVLRPGILEQVRNHRLHPLVSVIWHAYVLDCGGLGTLHMPPCLCTYIGWFE